MTPETVGAIIAASCMTWGIRALITRLRNHPESRVARLLLWGDGGGAWWHRRK